MKRLAESIASGLSGKGKYNRYTFTDRTTFSDLVYILTSEGFDRVDTDEEFSESDWKINNDKRNCFYVEESSYGGHQVRFRSKDDSSIVFTVSFSNLGKIVFFGTIKKRPHYRNWSFREVTDYKKFSDMLGEVFPFFGGVSENLIESVSSGKRKTSEFPKEPDLEELEIYLSNRGFKRYLDRTSSLLDMCAADNCLGYMIGPNLARTPRTRWIAFSDGKNRWFCRCCGDKYRDSFSRRSIDGGAEFFDTYEELRYDAIKTLGLK